MKTGRAGSGSEPGEGGSNGLIEKRAPLLQGYRGRPAADIEAVVGNVAAIARFVERHSELIMELEVNPLLVRRQGGGAYVADALLNIVGELPGEKL